MAYGADHGPLEKGECPAPISAIYKYEKGFYGQLHEIPMGTTNYTIEYGSVESNILYKVSIPGSTEYFILEQRGREGFNTYTPNWDKSNDYGVYIWSGNPNSLLDRMELKYADNASTPIYNTFGYTYSNPQDFANYTAPSSRTADGSYSNVAITNIHYTPRSPFPCSVNVLDEKPQPPNISIGGSWGSNPIISWTNNGETDINHYILKIEYDFGSGWGTPVYINPASSPYTDPNVIRLISGGDVVARYSVQAVDDASNSSDYSDYVATNGQSTWKKFAQSTPNNEVIEFSLGNNYPNPFNPTTQINYSLPESDYVTLKIYDNLGREIQTVVDSRQEKGNYSVPFHGEKLPSGIYFYTIKTNNYTSTKKMLFLK